ncbi:MAG: laccase domain-containing protein [Erysipelotrichaceae bacterium]|nr:laccase domain-containing protein [Erysipelotrichaceae bacterium]
MKYFEYRTSDRIKALTTTTGLGNVAFHILDDKEAVLKRRKEIAEFLNVDVSHLVFTHQSHSDVIKEATLLDIGRGSFSFEEGIEADSLYTKERGLAVGIFHADCVPIFFYDLTVPLVGIIHAGFPGTLKHIAYKAIKHVINQENLNPDNIKVVLGPSRRKGSYLLSDEEREKVTIAGCPLFDDYFDMNESNVLDLICAGIPMKNISDINIDTVKDSKCYSAYLKTPAGRMASLIILK